MAFRIVAFRIATICLVAAVASAAPQPSVPFHLRVDLQEAQPDQTLGLFVTLDAVFGVMPNLTISWALPTIAASQTSFTVLVTQPASSDSNTTVLSKTLSSPAQLFSFSRSALAPATAYDVVVSATITLADGSSAALGFSQPTRFYTSAGAALWAQSAPVWPPKCVGAPGPAQPQFALFHADVPVAVPAASDGVLSALMYVTAAPPIYNDPWNVTKLFSGFKLYINNSLAGVGPGHSACGPYPMSSCAPVQPVDGFDLTDAVRGVLAQGAKSLDVDVSAFGLKQDDYLMAPGLPPKHA
jgi:hypothetical protein